jgi:hypothetical protein
MKPSEMKADADLKPEEFRMDSGLKAAATGTPPG